MHQQPDLQAAPDGDIVQIQSCIECTSNGCEGQVVLLHMLRPGHGTEGSQ
jgi:hypothetical protein